MLISTVISEVSTDIFDPSNVRWSESVLLDFYNAAERQITYFKPTSYIVSGVYELAEGTKQDLPDGTNSFQDPDSNTLEQSIELIRVTRNMGTDGATVGDDVYTVTPADMDELYPGWRSATASATVVNVIYDPKIRIGFEVYPPQPSSSRGWLEIIYSGVPTPATDTSESMNLRTEYAEPIKNYIKHRVYSLDSLNSQYAASQAIGFWNLFLAQIGKKELIEREYRGANSGNSDKPIPK